MICCLAVVSCQVLILGAGMAGLTAFKTLVKEGITDIMVGSTQPVQKFSVSSM
jgi:cation diffusion facilitator CzcD-associated flavoprotein CzcO